MTANILLISCKDQPGIIATVTTFIHQEGGNIVYVDQYVDRENGAFFMRLETEFNQNDLNSFPKDKFQSEIAHKFQMQWTVHNKEEKVNMAIFVSKYNHCLYDLLSRHSSGELEVHIPLIISNHRDLEPIAKSFNIPFFCIEITKDNKKEAEFEQLGLLKKFQVDFIVLARYMQIVSNVLIEEFPNKIINIHHSFLPAFIGAKPYHSAYKRGVKIIGATSHYVTTELDAGPIIEQDVTRVTHSHSIKDFIAKGRDLEKIVLANAVKLHIDRKVMVYNNKTVIFY
ncbi:formyltetrahydrofolate deformylase [Aegicerativicinus sediminis]|uniref:formyltetrahydrofolate deformylase n=1 Tax=Aegicerativicinus sediminis TaxID=2893202 RepID=UPI001E5BB6EA|nr:formyltetrahydrofolate deformylase [Aegicerativicinus sediminis]